MQISRPINLGLFFVFLTQKNSTKTSRVFVFYATTSLRTSTSINVG